MTKFRQRRHRKRLQFFKPLRCEALEARAMLASQLVADILPGPNSSSPRTFEVVNGVAYFSANDGVHGQSLWKSDGTTAGTAFVTAASAPSGSGAITANVNGTLYFASYFASQQGDKYDLWKSDGSAAGTGLLAANFPNIRLMGSVGSTLFFRSSVGALWKSDGTSAGTVLVKNFDRVFDNGASFQGRFFFFADDGVHGPELWASDGTPAGTALVSDNQPGPGAGMANFSQMEIVNGALFFNGRGPNGAGLWKTDGTAAGTVSVKEIPEILLHKMNVNGTLIFFSYTPSNSSFTPWRSDGTTSNTIPLKVLTSRNAGDYPVPPVSVGGTVYFSSDDGIHGMALWKTDGTTAGTVMVKDINPTGHPDISLLTNVNGTLFFAANDGLAGNELWRSNGTAGGTVLVSDLNTGAGSSNPGDLRNVNGRLVFTADDGIRGRELWAAVLQANSTPVAANGSASTNEDNSVAVPLTATDADSDPLTYSIISPPAHGTLGGTTPNLTYTPSIDYNGGDTFTYRASDGLANSNVATVSITIAPINDAPVALNLPATAAVNASASVNLIASDVDNDLLTFAIATPPAHGTLSGNAPNLTYTPAKDFSGSDSFTYRAFDAQISSNLATVSITVASVNQPPTASSLSLTTVEDTPAGLTLAATDAESSVLAYSIVSPPLRGVLSGTAPNLTYTPTKNYNGSDSFTYRASDGTLDSNLATVSITVTTANDPPVASDLSIIASEDFATNVTLAASDPDNDPLTYTIIKSPLLGSLSGVAPNLVYTPYPNRNGSDSFTYRAYDGTAESNVATVTISIATANDPPIAADDLWALGKDVPTNITLPATDADLDPLTYAIISPPQHGTLSGTGRQVTYTPNLGYEGNDSFTYQASDGQVLSQVATITLVVLDLKVFAEDGFQSFDDWAQKLFPEIPPGGSPDLSFSTTNDNNGLFADQPEIDATGTLTFTPAPNSKGTAVVTVILKAPSGEGEEGGEPDTESGTFTIEIEQQFPQQNDNNPLDANDDFTLSAIDVLMVINFLDVFGAGPLDVNASPVEPYVDTNGDNYVSPIDALGAINAINSGLAAQSGGGTSGGADGEGEGPRLRPAPLAAELGPNHGDLLAMLAFDMAEHLPRRKPHRT